MGMCIVQCNQFNANDKFINIFVRFILSRENSESTVGSHVVDLLCTNRTSASLMNEMPHSTTTLVALFLLQMGISYGFIGFYTLGLTYVDDNTVEHTAPALIGERKIVALQSKRENWILILNIFQVLHWPVNIWDTNVVTVYQFYCKRHRWAGGLAGQLLRQPFSYLQ